MSVSKENIKTVKMLPGRTVTYLMFGGTNKTIIKRLILFRLKWFNLTKLSHFLHETMLTVT